VVIKEGNLEWRAAGAGEIREMNGFGCDKREEPPKEEDQKKVKKDRKNEKQRREK